MTMRLSATLVVLCIGTATAARADGLANAALPATTTIRITSTLDGTEQPVRYWLPENADSSPAPLFVFLHSWSGDYTQDNSKWRKQAVARKWIFLHPNFRGINNSPQACGSGFARQDILDAIDFACEKFNVDHSRIYLAGTSGGGHMAMLMAGHQPDRFSAVSAWVGISDLPDWYQFHVKDGEPQRYAQMILASLGGPPGTSAAIDADYRDRSPLFHLHHVGDLPIDINAGVRDGVSGSVPIRHSLNAFNAIAVAHGTQPIAAADITTLWHDGRLPDSGAGDAADAAGYGRDILLRRNSRKARVTIFDGGHEGLPQPACDWLAQQRRATRSEGGVETR